MDQPCFAECCRRQAGSLKREGFAFEDRTGRGSGALSNLAQAWPVFRVLPGPRRTIYSSSKTLCVIHLPTWGAAKLQRQAFAVMRLLKDLGFGGEPRPVIERLIRLANGSIPDHTAVDRWARVRPVLAFPV